MSGAGDRHVSCHYDLLYEELELEGSSIVISHIFTEATVCLSRSTEF